MLNVFASLDAVQAFLDAQVLPQVPGELRSELRAAIKVLADAGREIDALPVLLARECATMLDLLTDARALDGAIVTPSGLEDWRRRHAEADAGGLRDLSAFHEALNAEVGRVLVAIQRAARAAVPVGADADASHAACRALARHFYQALGEQARSRLDWQSVFPEPS